MSENWCTCCCEVRASRAVHPIAMFLASMHAKFDSAVVEYLHTTHIGLEIWITCENVQRRVGGARQHSSVLGMLTEAETHAPAGPVQFRARADAHLSCVLVLPTPRRGGDQSAASPLAPSKRTSRDATGRTLCSVEKHMLSATELNRACLCLSSRSKTVSRKAAYPLSVRA